MGCIGVSAVVFSVSVLCLFKLFLFMVALPCL